jgi:hypothetical protein
MVQWISKKQEYISFVGRNKLGLHGPRPFGKCLAQHQKECRGNGARLRRQKAETALQYQSQVLDNLRQWFQKERQYGHEVSARLIQDYYQKYLDKAVVTVKLE